MGLHQKWQLRVTCCRKTTLDKTATFLPLIPLSFGPAPAPPAKFPLCAKATVSKRNKIGPQSSLIR